jgi:CheY-like chemotaxis protein
MNNILIIDDNELLLNTLTAVFGMQLRDCTIFRAGNGAEGIAIMDKEPIDFILTDLDMPVVDGYGVISHRNMCCPRVPVFVMSGSLSPEARGRLVAMSVSGCIEKPFQIDWICERIARILNLDSRDGDVENTGPLPMWQAANA